VRALAAVPAPQRGALVGLPAAPGPLEAFGRRRDDARLLVVSRSRAVERDIVFARLGAFLRPGDVLVVNTSATLPAAVPTEDGRLLHFGSEFPGGLRLVELRRRSGLGSRPFLDGRPGPVPLPGGGQAYLLAPYLSGPRLWIARLDLPGDGDVVAYLAEHGRPIRYGSPERAWPLDAYQTIFATEPGSAEMPSAARGFTAELVTSLVAGGVVFAPVVLHCGVSSPETGEPPQLEPYRVPPSTATLVNAARAAGGRVVAVGTTATRALETTADETGVVHPGAGWTELIVTPDRGVRAVDALITGWHEPEASHLDLVEAVAGRAVVERSYALAAELGYRGHEFGDFHLVLP
jgi:S-adenosylmethionine:tRNA ribosyltransferase-isomerase